jgi:hypothetical protein
MNYDSLTDEQKNHYKVEFNEEKLKKQIDDQTTEFLVYLLECGEPLVTKDGKSLLEGYNMVKAQILDSLNGSKMSSSQIREKSIAAAKEWAKKQLKEQWKQESQGLN